MLPVSLLAISNSLILVNCKKCILNFSDTLNSCFCILLLWNILSFIRSVISDHLGQFFIIPNRSYSLNSKDIFKRNFKNFKEQNFLSDLKKVDWDTVFSDCKQDIDLSYKTFIDKITKLLDIHAPVKKLSHKVRKVYQNFGWPKAYFNP